MVFLPSRTKPGNDGTESDTEILTHGTRVIIDLIDVVGAIRDGDHLQCVTFLAQEFGLIEEPHFLFGALQQEPRRPHSLLLEGHFYSLLRAGMVDLDATGHLRLRRDLFALPSSELASWRLRALSLLSPHEAALFAAAVLHLASQGRHAGSRRHDDAFVEMIDFLAARHSHGQPVDVAAICATRRQLIPAEPILLTPV